MVFFITGNKTLKLFKADAGAEEAHLAPLFSSVLKQDFIHFYRLEFSSIRSRFKSPDQFSSEKAAKKSKVHLFLSTNGIDVLENKTKVRDWKRSRIIPGVRADV